MNCINFRMDDLTCRAALLSRRRTRVLFGRSRFNNNQLITGKRPGELWIIERAATARRDELYPSIENLLDWKKVWD
jgi:hypothetical protein